MSGSVVYAYPSARPRFPAWRLSPGCGAKACARPSAHPGFWARHFQRDAGQGIAPPLLCTPAPHTRFERQGVAEGYPPTGRALAGRQGKTTRRRGERGRPWRSALSRLMKGDSEWGKRLHRLVEGGPAAMSFQGRCIPHVQYMVQISKTPFPPESPCSPHSFWRAAREYPVRRDICSCTGCSAGSPQSFSSLPVLRV